MSKPETTQQERNTPTREDIEVAAMASQVSKTKKKPSPGGRFPGPGPGRPKGSKDKLPKSLKLRVLSVWEKLEAENKGLYESATKDPEWFYVNFIKPMLPKNVELTGEDGGPVQVFCSNVPDHVKAALTQAYNEALKNRG